jgi:hypothetical protein
MNYILVMNGRITFPSGAYGTDLPPWDTRYTQQELSALFYGGNSRLHRKLPLSESAALIPAQQPPYLFMSFHPPTLPASPHLSVDGFVGRLRLTR